MLISSFLLLALFYAQRIYSYDATEKLGYPYGVTGDVFHNAAAQILDDRIITVFMFPLFSKLPGNFGKEYYTYFKALGLPTTAIRVDAEGMDNIEEKARYIASSDVQMIVFSFDDWNQYPKHVARREIQDSIMHHYAATTVITEAFSLDQLGTKQKLQLGMTQGATLSDISAASTRLDHIRSAFVEGKKIVIVMYFHQVAAFQDSNENLYETIVKQITRAGHVARRMPVNLKKDDPAWKDDDIDFYGTRSVGDVPESKRISALFWRLAALDRGFERHLFGVVGPRTGSLDIAAMMGMRVFEYDQPFLHVYNEPSTWWNRQMSAKEIHAYMIKEFPQHLRMLMQSSWMTLGVLDIKSWDQDAKQFTRLEPSRFKSWLDNQDHDEPNAYESLLHLNLKSDKDADELFAKFENPAIALRATRLRAIYA